MLSGSSSWVTARLQLRARSSLIGENRRNDPIGAVDMQEEGATGVGLKYLRYALSVGESDLPDPGRHSRSCFMQPIRLISNTGCNTQEAKIPQPG